MRKHLVAVVLTGAALQGGAFLLMSGLPALATSSGAMLGVLGCARQMTASFVAPRAAVAATSPASEPANAPASGPTSAPAAEPVDLPAGMTRELPADAAKASPSGDACPANMVLVEGDYCPDVLHTCAKWLETTGRYKHYRCAEYTGAKCLSKEREHKRFCMDRDEFVPSGESLPVSHASWTDATRTCAGLGKRVCLESEWNFACEGEEMRPYPYGWKRDAEACNADRVDIYQPDGSLRDLRVGSDDKPRCVSPFGVHNLSGNLEEWTTIDVSAGSAAPRPAMKGAYWQPSRNHCRAAQTAHDRFYKGTETGFRCCADAP